ncbi:MAG: hypothetical protein R3B06_27410 [Kofleriaceae bacterium]
MNASPAAVVASLVAGLVLGGCQKDAVDRPFEATPAPTPAAPTGPGPGPTTPPPGGLAPHPAMTVPTKLATVRETMNAGGYTYARLDVDGAEVWAAGPETALTVGAQVTFLGGSLMENFHSTTLDRTFAKIYFVSDLPLAGGAAPAAAVPGALAAAPHGATPPMTGERIEPVAGGQAIAATLAGAPGGVGTPGTGRGQVVKWNGGILGHNWIHLQDGTGDLTVTTAATDAPLALGQVVVMRGTIATNKDFGAGYSYPVLLEDAAVVTPSPAPAPQ